MKNRPTIQMVAQRAGVSRGTVDRVLNNRSYVKASVRASVINAIRELGYTPRHPIPNAGLSFSIRLGVLLPNWTGHFKTEVLRGIEAAQSELAEFGVQVLVRECRTELPDEVIELIDELLRQNVNGFAICALNDIKIEQKIALLSKQNIPVITFNSDLPDSLRLCFIGQDYVKSGRIAGELMSKCVSRDAHILAMVGNLEFYGHRARLEGFCSRMRELGFHNSQVEIIQTYNSYEITYKKVRDAIAQTPDLAGIYMANRSVVGCTEAVKAAEPSRQIHVIAHDISETTCRLLKEGNVDFTISQDLYCQGYKPLVLLRDLLQKGKHPALNQIPDNMFIYCAENIDSIQSVGPLYN